MEAASIPDGPPASQRIRALICTYGLALLLLALPVFYAIQDLVDDGNLVRLGENLTAGISNGAIWALVAIDSARRGAPLSWAAASSAAARTA